MLLALLLSLPAFAIDRTVWTELGKVGHLQASFTQVQTRKVLKQPLTSTGTLEFTRPAALLWKVNPPYESTFSLEGNVAKMEYPALKMSQTIDLGQVPDANRLATSLMVWLKADPAAVERDFSVTYSATEATLVPKDDKLKGLIGSITITVAAGPWRVDNVSLVEPDGDRTELRFRSVVADGVALADPR